MGPMVGGAQRRPGCQLGRQPAAAEGAAEEPAADPAAEARLLPAARSWLCPALVLGEPVAPPPTLLRQGPCRRLLAMVVAIGSALASPVHAQGESDMRAGRQLATVHGSRCHGIDDERFILRPGALPLHDLGEALVASEAGRLSSSTLAH